MKFNFPAYILCYIFLFLNIHTVRCLQCYSCNNYSAIFECETISNGVAKAPCSLKGYACAKFTLQSYGITTLYRGCYFANYCNTLQNLYQSSLVTSVSSCETCREDYCNASDNINSNMIFVLVSLFLLYQIIK